MSDTPLISGIHAPAGFWGGAECLADFSGPLMRWLADWHISWFPKSTTDPTMMERLSFGQLTNENRWKNMHFVLSLGRAWCTLYSALAFLWRTIFSVSVDLTLYNSSLFPLCESMISCERSVMQAPSAGMNLTFCVAMQLHDLLSCMSLVIQYYWSAEGVCWIHCHTCCSLCSY